LQYYVGDTVGGLGKSTPVTGVQYDTAYLTVDAYIGQPLYFQADLSITTGGDTGWLSVSMTNDVSSSINGSNTSYTSITILDPNVSYITDSGSTYLTSIPDESASVPEPPALSMLGIAAIGIAGVKLRRRSVATDKADRDRSCPPEEQLVNVGRVDRSLQRSGRWLSGRNLPYRVPVRDSL